MRTPFRYLVFATLAAGLLAAAAAPAAAQGRAHIGPRSGVNLDSDDWFVGAQFTIPLTRQFEFYPSLDVYFPAQGTSLGINGDLKYRVPVGPTWSSYFGGGLNVLYRDANGVSDTDAGGNLLAGLESRWGNVHPFFEARVLLHDNTSLQLGAGLNITLY